MAESVNKIGVFDSGFGGLTILRSLMETLHFDLVYFGDTGRFPYGKRSPAQLIKYSIENSDLLASYGADVIVVACSTASAAALDVLAGGSLPVIGVIEGGVGAALQVTRNRRIGVIGTQCTIGSGVYAREFNKADPALSVVSVACPEFVDHVESGDTSSPELAAIAKRDLGPLLDSGIDTLVLGCTHYPLMAQVIQDVVGPEVTLVSAGAEVAGILRRRFGQGPCVTPKIEFVTSGDPDIFRTLGSRFLGTQIENVESWRWA